MIFLFVAICWVPILYNMTYFPYGAFTAFLRFLHTPFIETIWAPNFSEESFTRVKAGMNEEAVLALLGQPINYSHYDTYVIWHYSRGKTVSHDYDRRRIYFDTNGVVQKTRYDLYID